MLDDRLWSTNFTLNPSAGNINLRPLDETPAPAWMYDGWHFTLNWSCWFTSIFTIHFRLTILPHRQVPFPLQPPHWSVTTSLFFWTNVPFPIFYFLKKTKMLFWLKCQLNFLSWCMIISSLVRLYACLNVWNAFKNPEAWESEIEITFFSVVHAGSEGFSIPNNHHNISICYWDCTCSFYVVNSALQEA